MKLTTITIGDSVDNIHITRKRVTALRALDAIDGMQVNDMYPKSRRYIAASSRDAVIAALDSIYGSGGYEVIDDRGRFAAESRQRTIDARADRILRIRDSSGRAKARKWGG